MPRSVLWFQLRAKVVREKLVSIDAMQSMSCRIAQPGIETRRAGQGCDELPAASVFGVVVPEC